VGPRGFEPRISDFAGGHNSAELLTASALLSKFKEFCEIDLQLSRRTVDNSSGHLFQVRRFLETVNKHPSQVTAEDVRAYLSKFQSKSAYTRANVLKSLKRFFRDFLKMPQVVESFKFPKRTYTPKTVPSNDNLRRFFDALENVRDRTVFLLYATTGLRRNELLSLTLDDLDLENRTIIPKSHTTGTTKNSWVSCFNEEAQTVLKRYLETRRVSDYDKRLFPVTEFAFRKAFDKANKKTYLHITPQLLRFWFANEMSRLGMSDRFIDALQGRTPRSVLARHYSDFSVDRLKEAYDKAGLVLLNDAH
jgi:integrase/recombinase XerD